MSEIELSYQRTIVKSRYGGIYEGEPWLAFPLEPHEIPLDAFGSDLECSEFWQSNPLVQYVGKGWSAQSALFDLNSKLSQSPEGRENLRCVMGNGTMYRAANTGDTVQVNLEVGIFEGFNTDFDGVTLIAGENLKAGDMVCIDRETQALVKWVSPL